MRCLAPGFTRAALVFYVGNKGKVRTYCETPAQSVYDDLEHVPHLASLSDSASHWDVDKIILAVGLDAVKTAIICLKQAMVKVVVLETREIDKYKTLLV